MRNKQVKNDRQPGVKEAGLLLVADRKIVEMLVGVQSCDRGWQGKSTKF